jgi:hypothetical protein
MQGDHAFYVKYCIKCISSQFICALFLDVQDWDHQNPTQIVTEMCGFMTILSGTFLLHKTKDMTDSMSRFMHFYTPHENV